MCHTGQLVRVAVLVLVEGLLSIAAFPLLWLAAHLIQQLENRVFINGIPIPIGAH